MYKYIMALLCLYCSIQTINAQLKIPASSPNSMLIQTVGLTDIEISYSRPSIHGRTIFGSDGLIPYGEQWRTGANRATKFKFSTDVSLQGNQLEKGEYTVITIPSKNSWEVQFYPYESSNWTKYKEENPLLSLTLKTNRTEQKIETFAINIENIEMEGCDINIKWENVSVTIPLTISLHDDVLQSIDRTMAGPSAFDNYNAAYYLYKTKTDLPRALAYINKATSSKTQMFFFFRTESLILAELGRYDEAILSAKKSIELSKQAKNDDFVRLSMKSIEEWRGK